MTRGAPHMTVLVRPCRAWYVHAQARWLGGNSRHVATCEREETSGIAEVRVLDDFLGRGALWRYVRVRILQAPTHWTTGIEPGLTGLQDNRQNWEYSPRVSVGRNDKQVILETNLTA
jgi:hypothetical protein